MEILLDVDEIMYVNFEFVFQLLVELNRKNLIRSSFLFDDILFRNTFESTVSNAARARIRSLITFSYSS